MTIKYEVTHRLGVSIPGLGTRAKGGVFEVTEDKAARLHLDENLALKRIDVPVRISKPKAEVNPEAESNEEG
jgi:hypothetical protein